MPLVVALMALAALAGNTVVTAAVTDAWEAARTGFARVWIVLRAPSSCFRPCFHGLGRA
jgi:hypothetical protein